jgi:hypothetical protein
MLFQTFGAMPFAPLTHKYDGAMQPGGHQVGIPPVNISQGPQGLDGKDHNTTG